MRGLNSVIVSGRVTGTPDYGRTGKDVEVCGFRMTSDRHSSGGIVTACIKVNVYVEGLVQICRSRLIRGAYVLVEGELMNRKVQNMDLTEVRARDIIFTREAEHKEAEHKGELP